MARTCSTWRRTLYTMNRAAPSMHFEDVLVDCLSRPQNGFFATRRDAEAFLGTLRRHNMVVFGSIIPLLLRGLPLGVTSDLDIASLTRRPWSARYSLNGGSETVYADLLRACFLTAPAKTTRDKNPSTPSAAVDVHSEVMMLEKESKNEKKTVKIADGDDHDDHGDDDASDTDDAIFSNEATSCDVRFSDMRTSDGGETEEEDSKRSAPINFAEPRFFGDSAQFFTDCYAHEQQRLQWRRRLWRNNGGSSDFDDDYGTLMFDLMPGPEDNDDSDADDDDELARPSDIFRAKIAGIHDQMDYMLKYPVSIHQAESVSLAYYKSFVHHPWLTFDNVRFRSTSSRCSVNVTTAAVATSSSSSAAATAAVVATTASSRLSANDIATIRQNRVRDARELTMKRCMMRDFECTATRLRDRIKTRREGSLWARSTYSPALPIVMAKLRFPGLRGLDVVHVFDYPSMSAFLRAHVVLPFTENYYDPSARRLYLGDPSLRTLLATASTKCIMYVRPESAETVSVAGTEPTRFIYDEPRKLMRCTYNRRYYSCRSRREFDCIKRIVSAQNDLDRLRRMQWRRLMWQHRYGDAFGKLVIADEMEVLNEWWCSSASDLPHGKQAVKRLMWHLRQINCRQCRSAPVGGGNDNNNDKKEGKHDDVDDNSKRAKKKKAAPLPVVGINGRKNGEGGEGEGEGVHLVGHGSDDDTNNSGNHGDDSADDDNNNDERVMAPTYHETSCFAMNICDGIEICGDHIDVRGQSYFLSMCPYTQAPLLTTALATTPWFAPHTRGILPIRHDVVPVSIRDDGDDDDREHEKCRRCAAPHNSIASTTTPSTPIPASISSLVSASRVGHSSSSSSSSYLPSPLASASHHLPTLASRRNVAGTATFAAIVTAAGQDQTSNLTSGHAEFIHDNNGDARQQEHICHHDHPIYYCPTPQDKAARAFERRGTSFVTRLVSKEIEHQFCLADPSLSAAIQTCKFYSQSYIIGNEGYGYGDCACDDVLFDEDEATTIKNYLRNDASARAYYFALSPTTDHTRRRERKRRQKRALARKKRRRSRQHSMRHKDEDNNTSNEGRGHHHCEKEEEEEEEKKEEKRAQPLPSSVSPSPSPSSHFNWLSKGKRRTIIYGGGVLTTMMVSRKKATNIAAAIDGFFAVKYCRDRALPTSYGDRYCMSSTDAIHEWLDAVDPQEESIGSRGTCRRKTSATAPTRSMASSAANASSASCRALYSVQPRNSDAVSRPCPRASQPKSKNAKSRTRLKN